jgi:hypothetical protein
MKSPKLSRIFIRFFRDNSEAVAATEDTSGIKKGGDGINRIKSNNSFIIKPAFKDLAFSNIAITGKITSELSVGNEEGNVSDENGPGPFI